MTSSPIRMLTLCAADSATFQLGYQALLSHLRSAGLFHSPLIGTFLPSGCGVSLKDRS
jgi:hypothetical protein